VVGRQRLSAEFFGTTEPFLVIFFLIYFLIPVLVARQAPGPGATAALAAPRALAYVDGALVFGVPIAASACRPPWCATSSMARPGSALVLGAFYLAAATGLWRRGGAAGACWPRPTWLWVPVLPRWPYRWLSMGARPRQCGRWREPVPCGWDCARRAGWRGLAGYALQLAAGVAFVLSMDRTVGSLPVLNSRYLGCVLITMGAWFARQASRARPKPGDPMSASFRRS